MTAAPSAPADIALRIAPVDRANLRELNFVRSAWTGEVAKHRPTPPWHAVKRANFVEEHSAWVDAALACAATSVLVASHDIGRGEMVALGWISWTARAERTWLHCVYVKSDFRRFGVARALLAWLPTDGQRVEVTHWAARAAQWLKLPAEWAWNPEAMWRAV